MGRKEIVNYALGVAELGVSVYSGLLTIGIFLHNVLEGIEQSAQLGVLHIFLGESLNRIEPDYSLTQDESRTLSGGLENVIIIITSADQARGRRKLMKVLGRK